MRKQLAAVLLLSLTLGIANANATEHVVADVKQPELSGKAAFGKLAYDRFCIECHGQNVAGSEKGPSFLHRVYHPGHHSDRAFYLAVAQGARAHHWPFGNMPPVEGVTEQQVGMIIEYVRAMQKANGIF